MAGCLGACYAGHMFAKKYAVVNNDLHIKALFLSKFGSETRPAMLKPCTCKAKV